VSAATNSATNSAITESIYRKRCRVLTAKKELREFENIIKKFK